MIRILSQVCSAEKRKDRTCYGSKSYEARYTAIQEFSEHRKWYKFEERLGSVGVGWRWT